MTARHHCCDRRLLLADCCFLILLVLVVLPVGGNCSVWLIVPYDSQSTTGSSMLIVV